MNEQEPQRAKLTWICKGEVIVEEVDVVPHDAPIYAPMPDGEVVELPYSSEELMDTGRVFFEDETGIFGLTPEQIISVEIIGRNKYIAYDENRPRGSVMLTKIKKFVKNHKEDIVVIAVNAAAAAYFTTKLNHKWREDALAKVEAAKNA